MQKIEAPFAKAQSGINFKPRFEISFWKGTFLSLCSVLTSSSLLLGIMVWAVGTGMAIAMLLDVQVHHLHLQLQQLLTPPPLLVLRSTLFYHLAGLVRICLGPGSGDPKVAILNPLTLALSNFFYFFSPSSPLLLQLLLQLLLLGLLSCSSATHTGAAASRKQTRSTRLLTQSLHPPFRSRTLS